MPTRKPIEDRVAEAETKLKQLKALKAKQESREKAAIKKLNRQEDANKKIRLGGLIVLAGLADCDKGVLMGVLIDASKQQQDLQATTRWKTIGDSLLSQQASDNRHSAAAQTQG
ncbi:MAG: conjugal transfer protein TraD [Pseudomonadota bacterium]